MSTLRGDEAARAADLWPAPAGGPYDVLFADDEPSLRLLGKVVLEGHGYTVLPAEDGRQAVEVFRRASGRVALVLMDLEMPLLGGLEALRRMAELDPALTAVLMTGREPPTLPPDLARHVRGVLTKPYGATQMLRAVRAALTGG